MFLALRELKKYKTRYTLMSVIMVSILFLVFFITGLANGLSFADSSSLQNLKADYVVMNTEADGALVKSQLTEEQVKTIKDKLKRKATPITVSMSEISIDNEKDTDVAYFSVDKSNYPAMEIMEGKNIGQLEENEVIVDESIKKHGFKLNDRLIDKKSEKELIIAGFTVEQTYNFMPIIYGDFNLGLSKVYSDKTSYNAVLYSGTKVDIDGFDTLSREETVKSMPGYKETQGSFTMMKVFLFVISVFVSTVFFYVLTIQKLHHFGILKAIGANTGYIAKSIVIQVFVLTVIGLAFSSLAIFGINHVLPEEMPFRLSTGLILNTGAVFFALNLLGSLLSVYKAAKTDAIEAIGRAE
jgi:putative ABC transport system permease protein